MKKLIISFFLLIGNNSFLVESQVISANNRLKAIEKETRNDIHDGNPKFGISSQNIAYETTDYTIDRDSTLQTILEKLEDIDWILSHPVTERYKLYKTENLYIMLQLDTSTGRIKIVQWSLDDNKEFTVYLNEDDLSYGHNFIGQFELYPTSNMYQFILMDKIVGSLWHVQWGTEKSKMWIRRISF